jgi:hypothetical protein
MTKSGPKRVSPEKRFWSRVWEDPDTGCWYFAHRDAGKLIKTYPTFCLGGRNGPSVQVNRFAYELLIAPLDPEKELDHLCRNPPCVNPWHCEPVTHAENLLRSQLTINFHHANKTHCVNGHAFTPENTRARSKNFNHRECKICKRIRDRERKRKWRKKKRMEKLLEAAMIS